MTVSCQCDATGGKKGNSVADCIIQDPSSRTTGVLDPRANPCYSIGVYRHSSL